MGKLFFLWVQLIPFRISLDLSIGTVCVLVSSSGEQVEITFMGIMELLMNASSSWE